MAGAGTVFRGAIADVIRISPPEKYAETVAAAYLASTIGLLVPVIAGIALTEGLRPRATLLGLSLLIGAGIVLSAVKLLGGAHHQSSRATSPSPAESNLRCADARTAEC